MATIINKSKRIIGIEGVSLHPFIIHNIPKEYADKMALNPVFHELVRRGTIEAKGFNSDTKLIEKSYQPEEARRAKNVTDDLPAPIQFDDELPAAPKRTTKSRK